MWMFSDNGDYTAKSEYMAIQQRKVNREQGPSNSGMMESIWKKVWGLDTIPRHKMLLWRILNNALPVRDNLQRKGINCSLLCPRCEAGIETINHLFSSCVHTKQELFGSQIGIKMQHDFNTSFKDWLLNFIDKHEKTTIIDLATLLYSIWHARKQKVFENIEVPGEMVIHRACNNILSFHKAKSQDPKLLIAPNHRTKNQPLSSHPTRDLDRVKWIKPDPGIIKIKSDANLTLSNAWSIGVIAREESGSTLAAGTWTRPGFDCPTTAEAWGIYQAASFAQEMGFRRVHFESDNEKVVQLLQGRQNEHRNYLNGY